MADPVAALERLAVDTTGFDRRALRLAGILEDVDRAVDRAVPASVAWHEALADHLPELRARALELVRNPADVEDLVQDVMVRALQVCARPPESLRAWLLVIMANTWHEQHRQASARSRPRRFRRLP